MLIFAFASELKTNSGLSFPLFATKVTTHALYVKSNNTVCYMPLENGVGSTGSLNVRNGNDVYHVGTLDAQ